MDLKIDLHEYDDINKMQVLYHVDFTEKEWAKEDNLRWNPQLKYWSEIILNNDYNIDFEVVMKNKISKRFPIKQLIFYDLEGDTIDISDEAEDKLFRQSRFYSSASKTGFNFSLYITEKQQRKKSVLPSKSYTFGKTNK
jgi:hypothetical protein